MIEQGVTGVEDLLYFVYQLLILYWGIADQGFPGGSGSKESACNAGDPCLIPGLGGSSGEGNGNPLQYSCLENLMDRGAWQATVCGVTKSWTRLSNTLSLSHKQCCDSFG